MYEFIGKYIKINENLVNIFGINLTLCIGYCLICITWSAFTITRKLKSVKSLYEWILYEIYDLSMDIIPLLITCYMIAELAELYSIQVTFFMLFLKQNE